MSGLSHTPGKRARGKTLRGFESRLLRQSVNKLGPSGTFFIHVCHSESIAKSVGAPPNLALAHAILHEHKNASLLHGDHLYC